jgi:TRAP-type mannitol/chloroaromatic compound transport system substrate-binding protein
MKRRDILVGGGSFAAGAASNLAAPAIAQGIRQLKLVTDWPAGLPGLQASANRIAKSITALSDGRLAIEVFPAGTFVRAFETFDAVGSGIADMYHSADYYWEKKSPAFTFFAAVPFGFTADELFAWIHHGGGQELGDALYGQFNVKPLLCCNTGCQMGGWFNREVNAPSDLNGLRYRMPGLGGAVLRQLGATVVNLPGGEIVPSLKSGAIDASEWIGPWADMALGLHKAAAYYYYPGFHEPGTGITLGINKGVWEGFNAGDRRLIQDAAAAEYSRSLAEFNANNAQALRKLREEEGAIKILAFNDSLLRAFLKTGADVVAETGTGNELSRKIHDSYQRFRATATDWSSVADRAFLVARGLA